MLADAVAALVVPSDNKTLPTAGSCIVLNPVPEVPLVPDLPEDPAVPDVPEVPFVPEEPTPPDNVYWNCPVVGSNTRK